jgi:cobaltochelatase CobS
VRYPLRESFNQPEAGEAQIPGLKPGRAGVPKRDPFYEVEIDRMRDMTMFWVGGFRAMLIEGNPATGKTSFVTYWHAVLNVPLRAIACSPTTESYRLIGQMLPTADGSLRWQDGPVTIACREGSSVLLDEWNTIDPGEATALNMLLEGNSFTIPETGEVIEPAPTTRFFATQNSVDSAAAVSGRNILDVANDDRFVYLEVDYIVPDLEESIVVRSLCAGNVSKEVAVQLAKTTVTVANEVRNAFKNGVPAIEKPISTRVVLRWAKLAAMYQKPLRAKGISGIHYAMRRAVKMPTAMAMAVNEFITATVGFDENLKTATV